MSWLNDLIPFFSKALIFAGVIFILIGSIGLLRMPDLYLRMSASTKASTLGAGLVLLGTAVYFGRLGITSRAIATIIFLLLTGPVAAHMIAKAGYSDGDPLWKETQFDDLAEAHENYDTIEAAQHNAADADEATQAESI